MLQAMFSGVSGLQVHQTKLDVIGNNIANVSTIGFKSGAVSFEDQLSQTLRDSSSPSTTVGGVDPAQVGLGVQLGGITTDQSQGNLQTTGKLTDMAIQGSGFFVVGSGSAITYTRDGSFDLDGNGVLVNPATGGQVLGYAADATGAINSTKPLTSDSVLKIPIGTLTSVKQTTSATFQGNLDASSSLQSTASTFTGNVTTDPTTISATAYDALGNAHAVALTLSGKTSNAGTGNDTWTATMQIDGSNLGGGPYNAVFNTSTGAFVSTTIPPTTTLTGSNGAANFSLGLGLNGLTGNTAGAATATAATNGQTGTSPIWDTSIKVYDSLGVGHQLDFQFTRNLVGAGAPTSAAGQWSWTASENGNPVASSASTGNNPLYFDSSGNVIDTAAQSLTVQPPQPGAAPVNVKVDFSTLKQLAGSSSVIATGQDGFPVGTLKSYTISTAGLISGVFSNGQTQSLGQIAMATFSNPSGLTNLGNNQYDASGNSGLAQVGPPASQGRGQINTGFLELSNVDLSTEFTDLIVTERGFQANTRIITTVDNMLQDVINLKQGG